MDGGKGSTIKKSVDYMPYDDIGIQGKSAVVMARSKVVVEDDRYIGRKDNGRYLSHGPSQLPR